MGRTLYPDIPNPPSGLTGSFEVGTRFKDTAGGFVTALRFVRAAGEPNTAHTLRLWDAVGTELVEATAPAAAAGTWAVATLDTPYELTPDASYTVSVSITNELVQGGGDPPGEDTLTPLAFPGVFHDPPLGQFPDTSVGSSYWVDVDVEDEGGGEPPAAPGSLAGLMDEMANTLLAVVGPAVDDVEVQVTGRLNPNPTPPSIDIYPGDPFRDITTAGFQEVGGELLFTVRARVTTVDNTAGQNLLLRLMDDIDDISVAAALMEDQTLNGLASSVYVEGHSGYTRYLDGGVDSGGLLGCEWRVRVLRVLP